MKTFFAVLVLAAGFMSVGCAPPPAYSDHERGQMIARNWGYEWQQATDDFDHVMLIRPASHLTLWNVQ